MLRQFNPRLGAWGIAVLSLSIYISTLAPTVSGGDSGDFLGAICNTSIAHPPGYPLYIILGHLIHLVPGSLSIAYKMNLLSAVSSAMAATLLYISVTLFLNNPWAGLLSSSLLAFAPVVWEYSVKAEVFALNCFFSTALIFFYVLYLSRTQSKQGESKNLRPRETCIYLGALFFGIGMSNHHSLLFLGVPIAFSILMNEYFIDPDSKSILKKSGISLLLFLLGLLPYSYLFYAGDSSNIFTWDQINTWSDFLNHFLRTSYGRFNLFVKSSEADPIASMLRVLADLIFKQTQLLGFIFASLSILITFKRKSLDVAPHLKQRQLVITLLISIFLYFSVFFILNRVPSDAPLFLEVHKRFLIQLLVPLFFLSGIGIDGLHRFFSKNGTSYTRFFIPILATLSTFLFIVLNFNTENQSNNWAMHKTFKSILESVPKNAFIITDGDNYYVYDYLQSCLKVRPDVATVGFQFLTGKRLNQNLKSSFPELRIPGTYLNSTATMTNTDGSYALNDLMKANISRMPVLLSGNSAGGIGQYLRTHYKLRPFGSLYIINPLGSELAQDDKLLNLSKSLLSQLDLNELSKFQDGSWEFELLRSLGISHLFLIESALAHLQAKPEFRTADLQIILWAYQRLYSSSFHMSEKDYATWATATKM